jgi:hypothetical protein
MKLAKSGRVFSVLAALAAVSFSVPALAQAQCDRATLQDIADRYVKAQAQGSMFALPVGEWVDYRENLVMASSATGVLGTPQNFDWTLQLLDTDQCKVFVEGVIRKPKPYVLATVVSNGFFGVNQISTIVTDKGDWLFDAEHTYEYARREDWSEIPEDRRNTRAELIAAANAYLDSFNDKTVNVPWGTPCARLEGGVYTGKGRPDDSCNVGVPDGVELVDRSYVVDPAKGAVSVFLRFGGPDGLPDSHTFRIEDGKIRYVHTVTNCGDKDNCGFEPLSEMLAKNPGMQPPYKD